MSKYLFSSLLTLLVVSSAFAKEKASELCQKLNTGLVGQYEIAYLVGNDEGDTITFKKQGQQFSALIAAKGGMAFQGVAAFLVHEESCYFVRNFVGVQEQDIVRNVTMDGETVISADFSGFGRILKL